MVAIYGPIQITYYIMEELDETFDFGNHADSQQECYEKVNSKVQGVPRSQTAANFRHQEEEKNDKN